MALLLYQILLVGFVNLTDFNLHNFSIKKVSTLSQVV